MQTFECPKCGAPVTYDPNVAKSANCPYCQSQLPCRMNSAASRPGHALERAEEERRIQGALNRLSPEHRAVLIMKDMEGQKYEQMAEVLQVPIGTIRSRLHRARMELRDLLHRPE